MGRRTIATGYPAFPSIPRLHRDVWITEKIDGTNALVQIEEHQFGESIRLEEEPDPTILGFKFGTELSEDGLPEHEYWFRAGSRTRWLTTEKDNHGFGLWVLNNGVPLLEDLGPGLHYGEWYGMGINRKYALSERRFALFNAYRWRNVKFITHGLECVPVIEVGNAMDLNDMVTDALCLLEDEGSLAAPGFMHPEGIVVFHEAARTYFKATLENDEGGKPE